VPGLCSPDAMPDAMPETGRWAVSTITNAEASVFDRHPCPSHHGLSGKRSRTLPPMGDGSPPNYCETHPKAAAHLCRDGCCALAPDRSLTSVDAAPYNTSVLCVPLARAQRVVPLLSLVRVPQPEPRQTSHSPQSEVSVTHLSRKCQIRSRSRARSDSVTRARSRSHQSGSRPLRRSQQRF